MKYDFLSGMLEESRPPQKNKKRGRRNSSHNKTRGNYDSCYEIIIKKRNIDIFVDQKFEESGCQLRQKYIFFDRVNRDKITTMHKSCFT